MIKLIQRLRFLFLFIVLIGFCLFKGFEMEYGAWRLADYFFAGLILFSILVIGDNKKKLLFWLLIPAIAELILLGTQLYIELPYYMVFKYSIGIIFSILMAVACLFYTLADEEINITTLFGSLSAYLFIGIAYSFLYLIFVAISPATIQSIEPGDESQAIYFSFTTLTTLGYGDIAPMGSLAKTISWIEAFTGQTYIAIILAQLVGRYVAEHMNKTIK